VCTGRLFTWTRLADFNAVIVWKTFIDICFSIKSSLCALKAAYTKFRRMIWSMIWSCGHRSRLPMCTVTSSKRRRLHLEKAESIQLGDFRVGQATTGAEAQFWLRQPWRNLPLFFPHPPSDFCPSHFLTRVWGYHDGKIVELNMFVGKFSSILAV